MKNVVAGTITLALLVLIALSACIGQQSSLPQEQQPINQNTPNIGANQSQAGIPSIVTPWGLISGAEVSGKDIACVGKPPGTIRVLYNEGEDEYEKNISVVYAKAGNAHDGLESFVTNKIPACGYKLKNKSTASAAIPNFTIEKYTTLNYEKGENETLTVEIMAIENNAGEKYTLMHIGHTIYKESGETPSETETPTPEETSSGEESKEVTPMGKAAKWDNALKPLFSEAFGSGPKLTTFFESDTIITLEYRVDNNINQEALERLVPVFESAGYEKQMENVIPEEITMIFRKENATITISINPSESRITVMIVEE